MKQIHILLIPSVLLGAITVILFTSLLSNPQTAMASPMPSLPQLTPTTSEAVEPTPSTIECPVAAAYPESIRQWCTLITDAAARYGLDPDLIAAVMLQESGGDPNAYSPSGAVGLLQVMPRDGIAANFLCSGNPCFSRRPTMDQLFDPAFNLDYGSRMLSNLAEKHGSMREALYAYGPMDVAYSYADKVLRIYQNYH